MRAIALVVLAALTTYQEHSGAGWRCPQLGREDLIGEGYKVECWYLPYLEMNGAGKPELILRLDKHRP